MCILSSGKRRLAWWAFIGCRVLSSYNGKRSVSAKFQRWRNVMEYEFCLLSSGIDEFTCTIYHFCCHREQQGQNIWGNKLIFVVLKFISCNLLGLLSIFDLLLVYNLTIKGIKTSEMIDKMGKRQDVSNRMFLRPSPNEEVCLLDIYLNTFILLRYYLITLIRLYSNLL